MNYHDLTFDAMGCEIRLLIGDPLPGYAPAHEAAEAARRFIESFDAALSRFNPDSQLTALNEDPREAVPASLLLRRAVKAGLWSAERSGGLVDPTLLEEIVAAGYCESWAGAEPASLTEALAVAPTRRPAAPRHEAGWRSIEVDDAASVVRRPPGVGFDTGGSGKGLAADMAAQLLTGYSRFVVDCAGDVRVGGFAARLDPFPIHVRHPLDQETAAIIHVPEGGLATSGLDNRIWRRPDGEFAHHLLDPASGEPAWTGLIGATALGSGSLEAETLCKAALLSGPERGRTILAKGGGMLVLDDGSVELIGPVRAKVVGRRSASPSRAAVEGGVR